MPQFRYRAMTVAGEIVAGEFDAPSRDEVARRAEYLGHLLIEAEPATGGGLLGGSAGASEKRAPRRRDVTIFLGQLALLVGAGLTLEAALQTLSEDSNKALMGFANSLRSTISAGDGFAEALERHPTIIEPSYIA